MKVKDIWDQWVLLLGCSNSTAIIITSAIFSPVWIFILVFMFSDDTCPENMVINPAIPPTNCVMRVK